MTSSKSNGCKNKPKDEFTLGFGSSKLVLSKPIAFTYLLSILYNVCFFTQFSATPYLVKYLHLSDTEFGYVQTLFGVLQMLGGPMFGFVIQRWGIRRALHLCYLSTLVSGVALFFSYNIVSLSFFRLPSLFMHGQQGHQTLLSALTQPGQQRTSAFGRMGLTFGLGFIFTPLLTAISTRLFSDLAPFLVSAALCVVPCIILETCIPRSSYEGHESDSSTTNDTPLNVGNMIETLRKPGVVNILIKKNAPIVPFLLLISILPIHMIHRFDVTNEQNQFMQMMTGIFIMFANGFGVIWLRSKFEEQTLLKIGTLCFIIGYFLFATIFDNVYAMLIIMPWLSLGMSIVATVGDSLLTALVDENEQGLVLGTANSVNSLVRTFSPVVAGYLQQKWGFGILPAIGVFASLTGLVYVEFFPVNDRYFRKPKDE